MLFRSVTCADRKAPLVEHLNSRGITNIDWVDGFSIHHPFVKWWSEKIGPEFSLNYVSSLVTGLEGFLRFVESGDEFASFCDDDVVVIRDFAKVEIPLLDFVNLSVGVMFHVLPDGQRQHIMNNGGCEMFLMSRKFAEFILNNVDPTIPSDIMIFCLLDVYGKIAISMPVAQQTSIITKSVPITHERSMNWLDIWRNFKPTGVRYEDIRNESGYFGQHS